jgi:hypothetical protein
MIRSGQAAMQASQRWQRSVKSTARHGISGASIGGRDRPRRNARRPGLRNVIA